VSTGNTHTAWLAPAVIAAILAASNTSCYAMSFVVAVFILLCIWRDQLLKLLPPILTNNVSAIVIVCTGAALLIALLSQAPGALAAYAHLVAVAALATSLPATRLSQNYSAQTIHTQNQRTQNCRNPALLMVGLLLTAALVELLAWGTLPGDRELAFAGALRAWELRVFERGPLPWLALPAGGVLIFALLLAAFSSRRNSQNDTPVIDAPHAGRRVRVTGNIR
jgi:hypothetical protein